MPSSTHVVTGKVRLSYVNLLEAKQSEDGGKAKYSCTVLLPKTDTATKAKIDAAINAAKQAGQNTKFNGKIPAALPTPIHDGDGVRPSDGENYGPECKGCWVFTASTTNRPRVVDRSCNDILDATEIYSGMYARVGLDFYPYAANTKKGIGCSLSNVQKLGDGEPFVSRASVEDDFGKDLDDFDDIF